MGSEGKTRRNCLSYVSAFSSVRFYEPFFSEVDLVGLSKLNVGLIVTLTEYPLKITLQKVFADYPKVCLCSHDFIHQSKQKVEQGKAPRVIHIPIMGNL